MRQGAEKIPAAGFGRGAFCSPVFFSDKDKMLPVGRLGGSTHDSAGTASGNVGGGMPCAEIRIFGVSSHTNPSDAAECKVRPLLAVPRSLHLSAVNGLSLRSALSFGLLSCRGRSSSSQTGFR